MYKDISDKTNRVAGDWMDEFLRSIHLDIHGFGRWQQTNVSEINDFIIPDYELVYIRSGQSRITMDGEAFLCVPGTLLLFEPFHVYSALCLPGEPVSYYYLHFDVQPLYLQETLRNLMLGTGGNVLSPTEVPPLFDMFDAMYRDMTGDRPGLVALLYANFLSILVHMMRVRADWNDLSYPRDARFHQKEAEIVRRSVQYIELHLGEPLRVTDIAREVGVSPNYLFKVFMKVVRAAPSRFIATYRVKQAERMLKQDNRPIGEIADLLGFSSAFHFSKTFKSFFGVPPQTYRKNAGR